MQAAIEAVSSYIEKKKTELRPEHAQILVEIRRRLQRLDTELRELMALNGRLSSMGVQMAFDPATGVLSFSARGIETSIKINRADPNVPVKMTNQASLVAYNAATAKAPTDEERQLRSELERSVESYYQSAHRVLKLFGRIPALSKIRCVPISRVRNNLIEHPADGEAYTFGVGSAGPVVKPVRPIGADFRDEGLISNTEALIAAIVEGCSKAG